MANLRCQTELGEADGQKDSGDGLAYIHLAIPAREIPQWEALGWRIIDRYEGTHHARHDSVMGKWQGRGEPVVPKPKEYISTFGVPGLWD